MLCQNCGNNPASSYVHYVVNGVVKDKYLCSECALKEKMQNLYNDDIFKMFSSFFNDETVNKPTNKCESCGTSFDDILDTGRLGCGKCYDVVYEELLPTLKKVHGSISHIGKRPNVIIKTNDSDVIKNDAENELFNLKIKLKNAIENEEYEKAAIIRDEIRKKEGK